MSNERPGVYTSYEVSGSIYGGGSGWGVGLAAPADKGETGVLTVLTGYSQAKETFGGDLAELAGILFRNGAGLVYAVALADGDYAQAFAALMEQDDIRFMVCGSHEAEDFALLRSAIEGGGERGKYRIGIAECGETTAAGLVAFAKNLNSERMLLVSHSPVNGVDGGVAAAVCGVMAAESDPALPLNGAELQGLGYIGPNFSEGDISLLITGGVCPIETLAGAKTIIRGVSTRTLSGDTADYSWREINTAMIVDTVIPAVRDALKLRFSRAKNTAQTRGAIRTQVLVELEDFLRREIIDSYGDISAEADSSDPTVCLVGFSFTVAHGLNKIELRAHITV